MADIVIDKNMVERGLSDNLIVPKLEDDGLKAYIGDGWFYFGGYEFESTDPKNIPFETLVEEILLALQSFEECPSVYEDEYLYYYYYLSERLGKTSSKPHNFLFREEDGEFHCRICGVRVSIKIEEGRWILSSNSEGDEPKGICHDCLVEHCVKTDCSACEWYKFPDCLHTNLKEFYSKIALEE